MALADDIRAVADRANRDLDAIHDYFEHSKTVWRSFELFVDEGFQISIRNRATGTLVDQAGLIRLTPIYIRRYQAAFTFREFVSVFEVFLFDLLHRLLLHNPWQFGKNQLMLETVIRAKDREEILSAVIAKQLNELKYEKPHAWFEVLKKTVKLECPSDDEIESFAEVKATRDILEHNAGIVNEVYLRKAGRKARYGLGVPIEIEDSYHLESWKLLKKVVGDVSNAAAERLNEPVLPG